MARRVLPPEIRAQLARTRPADPRGLTVIGTRSTALRKLHPSPRRDERPAR